MTADSGRFPALVTVFSMIAILAGLAAGGLHVFAGVDHLAALAPLAVEAPSKAGRTGGFWGLGHGLGVVIVGGSTELGRHQCLVGLGRVSGRVSPCRCRYMGDISCRPSSGS